MTRFDPFAGWNLHRGHAEVTERMTESIAASLAEIADDIAAGIDRRYCNTHGVHGFCDACQAGIDQAAHQHDPDRERVFTRRPRLRRSA